MFSPSRRYTRVISTRDSPSVLASRELPFHWLLLLWLYLRSFNHSFLGIETGDNQMSATLKQLIDANPGVAPRGSVLPCETYEKIELDPRGERQRERYYLFQRAENFSIYHDSKMELFWGREGNCITLRAVHTKKNK